MLAELVHSERICLRSDLYYFIMDTSIILCCFIICGLIFGTSSLDQPGCGEMKTNFFREALRITGGSEAKYMEYPWMVLIILRVESTEVPIQGAGSIITPHFVLTAAHFFHFTHKDGSKSPIPTEYIKKNILVYAGMSNTKLNEKFKLVRCLDQIIIHPMYSGSTTQNDIALLHLHKEIPLAYLSPYVAICVPGIRDDFYDKLIAAGWGHKSTEHGDSYSEDLYRVPLDRVSDKKCYSLLQDQYHDTYMCTYDEENKRGVWEGDSGGPAMCLNRDNNLVYVCGIASMAKEEGLVVYTKVESYLPWIEETVERFS